MKAVIFLKHGGPEVLHYAAEVREPEIGADEVLVRVRACALNHLDLWVRRGCLGSRFRCRIFLGRIFREKWRAWERKSRACARASECCCRLEFRAGIASTVCEAMIIFADSTPCSDTR
jgi:hypothetical protein